MSGQDKENLDMIQENETTDVTNTVEENGARFKKKKDKEKKVKKEKKDRKKLHITWRKNIKTLRNGSYSVLVSVVVIAVVILLNMIVGQLPAKYTQFDISTGKLYTIGDETINTLKNLKEESKNESADIRQLIKEIVPTYQIKQ